MKLLMISDIGVLLNLLANIATAKSLESINEILQGRYTSSNRVINLFWIWILRVSLLVASSTERTISIITRKWVITRCFVLTHNFFIFPFQYQFLKAFAIIDRFTKDKEYRWILELTEMIREVAERTLSL